MKHLMMQTALAVMSLVALLLAQPTTAETIVSVTQITYDANSRIQCSAVRMNPGGYASLPADACTLGTEGSYGPDRITKISYDPASQITETDQGLGTSVQRAYSRYTYTTNGLKRSETDANGNLTLFSYDGFDRLQQVTYPSSTTPGTSSSNDYEWFTYDANGNRKSYRHRNGATIYYTYDALNREIFKDMPIWAGNTDGTSKDIYSGYDLQGHLLYARFGGSASTNTGITNVYDGLGRLLTATDAIGRPVTYSYNQAGARTKMTLPYVQASSTTYDYETYSLDNINRLLSLSYTAGTTTSTLFGQTYDNLGHRTNLYRGAVGATGAVVTTTYGHDGFGRLTGLYNDLASTAYDINWTFSTYNPASQIAAWNASSTSYDYKEVNNSVDSRTYNGLNQDAGIAGLTASCATAGAGYDCGGNLTSEGTGGRTLSYDAENRLLAVTGGSANLTLSYDPLGRLYIKTYGTTTDTYLYDGVNLIGEYTSGGTQRRRYVFGAGTDEPLVWFEGQTSASPRYLISNYQGSIIAYTNNTGTVQELYKYGPYGEPKGATDVDLWSGSRFRYTGQTTLPEANLYYYKARAYDPKYGRFLQTDPIGSKDDLDLYAYTGDDPVNRADPTGLESITAEIYQDYRDHGGKEGYETYWTRVSNSQEARRDFGAFTAVASAPFSLMGALEAGGTFIMARTAFATTEGSLAAAEGLGTEGLRRTMNGSITSIRNIITNNGTASDFLGAARESRGVVTGFDHVTEMKQSITGLEKAAESLAGSLKNPNLTSAARASLEGWKKAADTAIVQMTKMLQP